MNSKTGIFFHSDWRKTSLESSDPIESSHPMMRRMSVLQKVVSLALLSFKAKHEDFWREYILSDLCRIYYASVYGEIDIMSKLSRQIIEEDFPISPRDFQNSVHNAAPAYASMLTGFTRGMLVGSSGFLSADKTLYLASTRIQHGLEPMALLIHAHGVKQSSGVEEAQAEMLLLGDESFSNESLPKLGAIANLELISEESELAGFAQCASVYQSEEETPLAWLSASFNQRGLRISKNLSGFGVRSEWI